MDDPQGRQPLIEINFKYYFYTEIAPKLNPAMPAIDQLKATTHPYAHPKRATHKKPKQ